MSYHESSYKQLLFGVSQQEPKDRLDGQNEDQVNMSSDIATGVRRRPPLRFRQWTGITTPDDRLAHFDTTAGGKRYSILVNTVTGQARVLGETGMNPVTLTNSYLQAASGASIRFATVGESMFIANLEKRPQVQTAPGHAALPVAARHGYFYVLAGQFSKQYRVVIHNRNTGQEFAVLYNTPDGTGVGDPALAAPEWIARQLMEAAQASPDIGTGAGVQYERDGPYVYVSSANFDITVSSGSGGLFIQTSLDGDIRSVGDLPARLPNSANGLIVGVGATKARAYFRWDSAKQAWLEDAAWDSYQTLVDMPVRLFLSGVWVLETPVYERRAAGDTESNPNPHFTEVDLTGIGSFQGRLVLLSNDFVNMSASNEPLRWYRSTVESLESDDPIEIASTAAQSAPYQWAVPFNRDLMLWSTRYQAAVPGATAVTPANANISVLSQYEARLEARPILAGRSVFFAAPRSRDFAAVWEAVPSDFADGQFIATDVTNHIPRYIPGDIRFLSAAATSGMVVAGFTGALNTLLVHEYLWQGSEKVHHAWHKWVFAWDIVHAWFVDDKLNMYVRVNGELVYTDLDLRVRTFGDTGLISHLDLMGAVTANGSGHVVVDSRLVDAWYDDGRVWAFKTGGQYKHMSQTMTELFRSGGLSTMEVPGAVPGDTFLMGRRFTSSLVPTAPTARDHNDVPITTARTFIHKWIVTLNNTGEFTYTVSDKYRPPVATKTSPLKFGSPELDIGQPLVAGGYQYIPARLDMATCRLELSTDDVYDLNITSLEYGFRFHQRYGKRR